MTKNAIIRRFSLNTLLLAGLCIIFCLGKASAQNVVSHGGRTMQDQINVFLIYWLPPGVVLDPNMVDGEGIYKTLTQRFFDDISQTKYLNIVTQYPGSCAEGQCVLNNRHRAVIRTGTFVDQRPYPHAGTRSDPLQDGDIQAEVIHAISANRFPVDENTVFFVFTGVNSQTRGAIEECQTPTNCTFKVPYVYNAKYYCGYHNSFLASLHDFKQTIVYSYVSDAAFNTVGCISPQNPPNGQIAADQAVAVMVHEFFELITDPVLNDSWYAQVSANQRNEIADNCAGTATVRLGSRNYFVPMIWSNASKSCVTAYDPASTATSLWRFTGEKCKVFFDCPGWLMLDNNPATITIASNDEGAGVDRLYELRSDHSLWQYTGELCEGAICPGWKKIDDDSTTASQELPSSIVAVAVSQSVPAAEALVSELRSDGSIWNLSDPFTVNEIAPRSSAIAITATNNLLFSLHADGSIYSIRPSLQMLDNNAMTVEIVSGGGELYKLHIDHSIWRYTGAPCSDNVCSGWKRLDNNPATEDIVADVGNIYKIHADGSIYRFNGTDWDMLDGNSANVKITATNYDLYKLVIPRHIFGTGIAGVWRFRHPPTCDPGGPCPGWEQLDNHSDTLQFLAGDGLLYHLRSNSLP